MESGQESQPPAPPAARARALLCLVALLQGTPLFGQIAQFPYTETFDRTSAPALPDGWRSSRLKSGVQNDAVLSTVAPRSAPNSVFMTNATIGQSVTMPAFDFRGRMPGHLALYLRRSATFNARLAVEASGDSGATFPMTIGHIEAANGSSGFSRWEAPLPASLAVARCPAFRVRVLPDSSGTSGTIRLDDFEVTVQSPCDLTITTLRWESLPVREGDAAVLVATVKNAGYLRSPRWIMTVSTCADGFPLSEKSGVIGSFESGSAIEGGDSLTVRVQVGGLMAGRRRVTATVEVPGDENAGNNSSQLPIAVGFRAGSIVINEIMAAPAGGFTEYVEIANTGITRVNLEECAFVKPLLVHPKITVLSGGERPLIILPDGFLVIASDSSIFGQFGIGLSSGATIVSVVGSDALSLKNDGDTFVLRDSEGEAIDSVTYASSWHNPSVVDPTGKSLEKVRGNGAANDPRNWGTCSASSGGTPGRSNSIMVLTSPSSSKLSFSPNPFSPDFDGRDDFTLIQYVLTLPVSAISVRVYDVCGRLIRVLENNSPAGAKGEMVWDGRDDDRRRARIGMYLVVLEAIDPVGGAMESVRGVVVLAARL